MLSEALRLIRVFHDMKSNELAEQLGISPAYLSEIEKGKKKPSLQLINKYAEVFHTSTSVILFFAEDLERNSANHGRNNIRKNLVKFMQALERFSNGDRKNMVF